MQTVLVASSKGGCGKTTVVTNLATAWAQKGENTTLVDADRQRSSTRWCARRPDTVPGVLALEGGTRRSFDSIPADTRHVIIDTAAGCGPRELEPLLERAGVVLVPVLPSVFDLDATADFLAMLGQLPPIRRGKLPVALVGNRLKPWTRASHDALEQFRRLPFPLVAELRDSQAYVLLAGLGKGIFDYGSEQVRSHQADWRKLLRWIKRNAPEPGR